MTAARPGVAWVPIPVRACPRRRCRTIVDADVPHVGWCPHHGLPLRRRLLMAVHCPVCGTAHWEHGRYCVRCGSPTWRVVSDDPVPRPAAP
jgi:Zn finger protein HypA/HybF involved in hydrogenase expression